MKLLYIWIEEFRNIHQQGFSVDNEYIISFNKSTEQNYKFLDLEGRTVVGSIQSNRYRKVYYRDFVFRKNPNYLKPDNASLIQSITALVGENASGKSSIMECIYRRADQSNSRNSDQRYYCLVFLDEDKHCLIVRTRDVWLSDLEFTKTDLRQNRGYEEYVIPLLEFSEPDMPANNAPAIMVSIYQDHREKTEWAYLSLGQSTYPINLSKRTIRHDFLSIFDFMCAFPTLGGEGNSIVFYLRDSEEDNEINYFVKEGTTPDEYKQYFILKLAQLLFTRLRNYLYHPEPEYSMSGQQTNQIGTDLLAEDLALAEQLSFLNRQYPICDEIPLIREQLGNIPENKIAETINIFRHSTFTNLGKFVYNDYLNCIEQLFTYLYQTNSKYFTGFYCLKLPFNTELRNMIASVSQCLISDSLSGNWAEDIAVDLEWLSVGEYQRALLFSGLYDVFNSKIVGEPKAENLILLFDEPEVHMHPEAGRKFIENLTAALKEFREHGLINQCQLILATHSPFIIQQLADYNSGIELVEKKNGCITWQNFNDLNQLSITTPNHYSFNLVMYYIFDVPTIELHIELYGYIQKSANRQTIASCDKYIAQQPEFDVSIHLKESKYKETEYKTLPTYIRNAIDHPDPGRKFTVEDLRTSTNLLIEICKRLNSSCD